MSGTNFQLKFALDRFNSFLVATAFLIAAFVSLVIYYDRHSELLLLGYAVNAVGLYLAAFFTIASYHGAMCIRFASTPQDKDAQGRDEPRTLFRSMIKSLVRFPFEPFAENIPLVHTWLIPLLFCLFWLATWFGVLPIKATSSAIVIGAPLLYLLLLGTILSSIKSFLLNKISSMISCIKSKRANRRK